MRTPTPILFLALAVTGSLACGSPTPTPEKKPGPTSRVTAPASPIPLPTVKAKTQPLPDVMLASQAYSALSGFQNLTGLVWGCSWRVAGRQSGPLIAPSLGRRSAGSIRMQVAREERHG
jgi:hypothetical protein